MMILSAKLAAEEERDANNTLVVIGVVGMFGLSGAVTPVNKQVEMEGRLPSHRPGRGRRRRCQTCRSARLPSGRAPISRRAGKITRPNKRINSRLFNGPTNISANVRIVLPGDPPVTHETTADLWIVTEGRQPPGRTARSSTRTAPNRFGTVSNAP